MNEWKRNISISRGGQPGLTRAFERKITRFRRDLNLRNVENTSVLEQDMGTTDNNPTIRILYTVICYMDDTNSIEQSAEPGKVE